MQEGGDPPVGAGRESAGGPGEHAGSHRAKSQSSKIAKVMSALLERAPEHCETTVIDLADNPLPLWDASIWSGDEAWQERLTPISAQLASSDALTVNILI